VEAGARLDHRERAGSKRLPSSVQKKTSISLTIARSDSRNVYHYAAELRR
jgi:hypothetical protein